jgi:hypothetical protein
MFNCHGYAWLRVEKRIDRWVGYRQVVNIFTQQIQYIYMSDGSYIEVSQETYPGKVAWASGDHSGITTDEPGWFISKWWTGVLCKHRWDDSPYGSTNLKYYVKNPCMLDNPPFHFINQTVITDTTVKDCRVNIQNVKVQNGAKLEIEAELEVIIDGPFEVEDGAELEIW